jgi:type IV pilus assembly protein PilB
MNENVLIEDVDLKLARKIPLNQAKEYKVLPLYEKEDKIYIATSNDSQVGKEFLNFLFEKKLFFIKVEIKELLLLINGVLDYGHDNMENIFFEEAIVLGASDIHYEPVNNDLNIRFRINGSLILVRKLLLSEYGEIISRLKVRSNMDITEKRIPQDGKLFMNCDNREYNCRLSTIPVVDGEKMVLRILYEDKYLSDISELNFTEDQQKDLNKIIELNNGLVIVNGPTGSGKSTTLYTILNSIKGNKINITTLEDPIEVRMEGVNQINLNAKKGITFSTGLRSVLRQDPDVIMLGEIRDEETAKMAVRAAITGHKVYSTIHTKSPREVFLRLEEMGINAYLVRAALGGIVSQRLIRILCEKCRRKIGKVKLKNNNMDIYTKQGCDKCNGIGYAGRALVSSVNYIDRVTREKIKSIYSDESLLSNEQMISVIHGLLIKGSIDYYDYLDFIQGEELDESTL